MKSIEGLESINILSWFPGHLIVSRPWYKILQLTPIHTRILHPFHLILLIAVHIYWGGRRNFLSREGIFRNGI
jgi:hypothetical protein